MDQALCAFGIALILFSSPPGEDLLLPFLGVVLLSGFAVMVASWLVPLLMEFGQVPQRH
ncbi:MAG: hypothetical protein JWN25_1903 [Verrucomicrobiales bacterium]|nr:hypothetical protein [Verrucomicrobiales bacterium]